MKSLWLMRHAKSSWDAPSDDHARPLAPRGERDAVAMARQLAANDAIPDAVICSDATRTRETLAWLLSTWGREVPTRFTGRLYLPTVGMLLDEVEAAPEVDHLLVLCHNPCCELALDELTARTVRMKTADVAQLTVDAESWTEAVVHRPWRFVARWHVRVEVPPTL